MWDNFPIMCFTKNKLKYKARENELEVYINDKCALKIMQCFNGNIRGFRTPLAIVFDSDINPQDLETIIAPRSERIYVKKHHTDLTLHEDGTLIVNTKLYPNVKRVLVENDHDGTLFYPD